MISNNNGGTVEPDTAVRQHSKHSNSNTTGRQIESLSRFYGGRQQLTHEHACSRLRELGFEHTDRLPTADTGRIPSRGKGPSNTGTAVSWTADGQALHWYEFTSGDQGTIFADRQQVCNPAESARRFAEAETARRKAEAERQALQERAARQAQDMWRSGESTSTHAYITHKQLSGLYNARIDAHSGALLIPMWVSGVGLVNVQSIYPDGSKLFLKGGRVKSAYSLIGSLNDADRVLIAEGWATACTLFELHGLPVVVAFNAGNLMDVCQALRSRFTDITVIVAGDDDRQTIGNPGRRKAIEAAEAIGATLAFPDLCKCCTCTDHNDRAICDRRCGRG